MPRTFEEFAELVDNTYQTYNTTAPPLVLTLMNPDGSVSAVTIDAITVLDTGHPFNVGERCTNIVVIPVKG